MKSVKYYLPLSGSRACVSGPAAVRCLKWKDRGPHQEDTRDPRELHGGGGVRHGGARRRDPFRNRGHVRPKRLRLLAWFASRFDDMKGAGIYSVLVAVFVFFGCCAMVSQ